MNPGYYAVIPASVRYDKTLSSNAKLLYGEITALCNKEGFCWAENEYFAHLYDLSIRTIQRLISQLSDSGYFDIVHDNNAKHKRKIMLKNTVTKMSQPMTKMSPRHDKNVIPSIYSINNTINTVGSALNFVLENYSIRFEQEFLIPFEKQFKSQELFDKFLRDFNNEAEMKERVFGSWLIPFMKKYVENWLNVNNSIKVISMNQPSALAKKQVI